MPYDPLPVAAFYAAFFPARSDVYSRWTRDGWRPLREPLTPEIVLAGLTGTGPSISGFMIAPGSVSHSLAIDFDRDDGHDLAIRVARSMWGQGFPAYVETSRRGAHLWAVLDTDVLPARTIRHGLWSVLQRVGIEPHDPKIEIRPGSDHVADDGLGHALRLPLMPHPKTGRRGTLMDPITGESIGKTLAEVLLEFRQAPVGRMVEWAELYSPPPVAAIPTGYDRPREPFPDDDSRASDILRDLWGVANARPGRSVKCPAHEDTMPSLSILRDDRRVICKAPACVLNNGDRGRGTYELRKLAPVSSDGG